MQLTDYGAYALQACVEVVCMMMWDAPGGKLELDEDEVPVVIAPSVAAHLRALADVLLRNGESGAFKAYVEVVSTVRPPHMLPRRLPQTWSCIAMLAGVSQVSSSDLIA